MTLTKTTLHYNGTDKAERQVLERQIEKIYDRDNEEYVQEYMMAVRLKLQSEGLDVSTETDEYGFIEMLFVFQPKTTTIYRRKLNG